VLSLKKYPQGYRKNCATLADIFFAFKLFNFNFESNLKQFIFYFSFLWFYFIFLKKLVKPLILNFYVCPACPAYRQAGGRQG